MKKIALLISIVCTTLIGYSQTTPPNTNTPKPPAKDTGDKTPQNLMPSTPPQKLTVTITATPKCITDKTKDSTVTLTATGADTYTWSPAKGLNQTTGSSVIDTPKKTTTITVTGMSNNAVAPVSASIVVIVNRLTPCQRVYIWVATLLLFIIIFIWLALSSNILKDESTAVVKPYSLARVQLAWWTFIILPSIVAIIICTGQLPDLSQSTLILLGIGALTTAGARITDISDTANVNAAVAAGKPAPPLSRNSPSNGFAIDILSDNSGVSIHRFQTVVFNFVFGIWFLYQVACNIKLLCLCNNTSIADCILPLVSTNNLILLGLSAGTYVALKTGENK